MSDDTRLATDSPTRVTKGHSRSSTLADKLRPYFPRCDFQSFAPFQAPPSLERPRSVEPTRDTDLAQHPLLGYNAETHDRNYAEPSENDIAMEPPEPNAPHDHYLMPSLAYNERLRLTVLWHYTRGIEQDHLIMIKIDAIIQTVQENIGWEYAIVGLLDEAIFTRLATSNLPVALLPRRENISSHTINQPLRSVFMSTNLTEDWRFKNSPQVKSGGMRSYAGTQVVIATDDGQDVALGSLCVTSDSVREPLSSKQRTSLIRFAEMLSREIVENFRQRRLKCRASMTENLLSLQSQVDQIEFVSIVLEAVRQQYPGAHVSAQESKSGIIELQGREPVDFLDTTENLWEDTSFIEATIKSSNHQRLTASQTVRLIAAQCGTSSHYLVVANNEIQHVFDNLDAWFVERCAALIAEARQKQLLLEALKAKERFLRGVTHTLRTPLHGILGAVDLLSDEIMSGEVSKSMQEDVVTKSTQSPVSTYLTAIRSSGRELMSTVNNILKFNTLTAGGLQERGGRVGYDLRDLGRDILNEALQVAPVDQMKAISIRMENNLSQGQSIIATDGRWLQDCLQPLLLNGIQSVLGSQCGVITTSLKYDTSTSTLTFDCEDTGIGIRTEDQKRIFSEFEKVDDHTAGVGLGLTLARKIAEKQNGSITLVKSSEGLGSHFQAKFNDQSLSRAPNRLGEARRAFRHLPRRFYQSTLTSEHDHMLSHMANHLQSLGFEKCEDRTTGFMITHLSTYETDLSETVSDAELETIVLRYSTSQVRERIVRPSKSVTVVTVTGPFYGDRLDNILQQVDLLYAELIHSSKPGSMGDKESEAGTPPTPASIPSRTLAHLSTASMDVGQDETDRASRQAVESVKVSELKALLVDDNVINLRILQMFCHKKGISYTVAQDGFQAEDAYRKALDTSQPINLILMDLQMPKCDGAKATAAIRSMERKEDLPRSAIFIVTGQDSVRDKVRSRQAGADEFLVKPVSLKLLQQHIAKYFEVRDVSP